VDELWHAAILDTQFYASLQDALGVILHHRPSGYSEPEAREKRLAVMKSIYSSFFGELPPELIHAQAHGIQRPQRARGLQIPIGISIFVQTPNRKTIQIAASSEEYIYDLKTLLEPIEGIPARQQRLLFDGYRLEDGNTLADYAIGADSTLYLFPELIGC
jgi:hypothetical protein